MTRLNVSKLIEDRGGAAAVAKAVGVSRTTPYGWVSRQYLSSRVMEALKAAYPDLNLDDYFESDHAHKAGPRAGAT